MSQNNIKFVNNDDQIADSSMIMSFLNNGLLGSILKTKNGEFFILIEERERSTINEYLSVYTGYTLFKNPLGDYEYVKIARASVDEIYRDNKPDTFYLATLFVEENLRDRGIGSEMVKFLQSLAAERGFDTFRLNAIARFRKNKINPEQEVDANECFYLKNGFVPIIFRANADDSIKFVKIIKESDKQKNTSKTNEDELVNSIY